MGDMAQYMKERRLKRRQHFIANLGGECQTCHENDTSKLHFDHIDPKTKEFNYNRAQDGSMERLENEMKKIQLLCRTCHLKKTLENGEHLGDREPWRHGSVHAYRNKSCRCDECREANREYNRKKRE